MEWDGQYAHLIRANSRFWNVSGVKADIGLTGGTIEVETVQKPAGRRDCLQYAGAGNGRDRQGGPSLSASCQCREEWLEWSPHLALSYSLFVKNRPCAGFFMASWTPPSRRGARTVVRCRPLFWVSEIAPCTTTPTSRSLPASHCGFMPSHLHGGIRGELPATAAARSIRVNTLKITVSEFVARMAPLIGSWIPCPGVHRLLAHPQR